MSSLAHDERQIGRRTSRRGRAQKAGSRKPYFVMNGATIVSIAAIALTVIGLLYLIQTSQVAELGYDMSRLQTQRESLTMEIAELEYEVSRYESIRTVEGVARDQLGMTSMSNYQFVEIQEPAQRELTLPDAEKHESATWYERILDAVMGIGSANSETAEIPEHSSQGAPR